FEVPSIPEKTSAKKEATAADAVPVMTSNTIDGLSDLSRSRPVLIYDTSISSADTYILHRAYLEGSFANHNELVRLRLIQKFAFVYGQSLSHPSLRQAVLLYCRPFWRETCTWDEIIEQRHRALNALRRRISDHDSLDEG